MPKPAIQIETEIKSGNWNEFVKIFAPITSVMMALTVAYGASPSDLIPGGNEVFEQHLKALLSGGGLGGTKGLPSPEDLEKLIEGAAQMGAQQAAKPPDVGKVQQLTQENLAKLVKETAIKNGMVMPGGLRRASTALPAVTAPLHKPPASFRNAHGPVKAKSAVNIPQNIYPAVKRPSVPVTKTPTKAPTKPKPSAAPPSGPMQEVMTASGVMIKIPKTQVEEAKKTGTIITKNGLVLRIGKDDIEEAEKKKGDVVMTAGGVPIKISPSGGIVVEQKADTTKRLSGVSKAGGVNGGGSGKVASGTGMKVGPKPAPAKLGSSQGTLKKAGVSNMVNNPPGTGAGAGKAKVAAVKKMGS